MNKAEFLHDLAYLLIKYDGRGLVDIDYTENTSGEFAEISYADTQARVNITGDSVPAMLVDIGKAFMK